MAHLNVARAVAVVWLAITCGACAGTTDNDFFLDVYWTAARECEAQHSSLHVERIATDGSLSVSAPSDSRIDAGRFRECYWAGVPARIERRRGAGLPVPEGANPHPGIDID